MKRFYLQTKTVRGRILVHLEVCPQSGTLLSFRTTPPQMRGFYLENPMAIYINWLAIDQPIRGDVLPIPGSPVANYTTTSGTAPESAQMAIIKSDAAFKVSATHLKDPSGKASGKETAYLANETAYIPYLTPLQSVVTVTAL